MDYRTKYLKYKNKYKNIKNIQYGGSQPNQQYDNTQNVENIREIFENYNNFYFDCDGVIWNTTFNDGDKTEKEIRAVVLHLLENNKNVKFITNNSSYDIDKFKTNLINKNLCYDFSYNHTITSAFTTAAYLYYREYKTPFIISDQSGIIEECKQFGITNYIHTITDPKNIKNDEYNTKDKDTATLNQAFFRDKISMQPDHINKYLNTIPTPDCIVVGWDNELSSSKISVAINILSMYPNLEIISCSNDASGTNKKHVNLFDEKRNAIEKQEESQGRGESRQQERGESRQQERGESRQQGRGGSRQQKRGGSRSMIQQSSDQSSMLLQSSTGSSSNIFQEQPDIINYLNNNIIKEYYNKTNMYAPFKMIGNGPMADIICNCFDIPKNYTDVGKPSKFLRSLILLYNKIDNIKINKEDSIMIGDTITTDIEFGNRMGMSTLLVFSGVTTERTLKQLVSNRSDDLRKPHYMLTSLAELYDNNMPIVMKKKKEDPNESDIYEKLINGTNTRYTLKSNDTSGQKNREDFIEKLKLHLNILRLEQGATYYMDGACDN